MQPTIIGLDLGKTIFQVHGVDAAGKIVLTRRLRRDGALSFHTDAAQTTEVAIGVAVLNRMLDLGHPDSVRPA